MATVLSPPGVFTPEMISGSRNDCIPMVLFATFIFHSNVKFLAVCGDILVSPCCHASRAGSALLVVHSCGDFCALA